MKNEPAKVGKMTGNPSGDRITFVMSHLSPSLGLERVALNLMELLDSDYDVHVICIGGSSSDLRVRPQVEVLGAPLTGPSRIWSVLRLWKHSSRRDLGKVILVGVWAAIPWLILPGVGTGPAIVWEHSLMVEKNKHSRSMRLLWLLARATYRRANAIVAVSKPVRDDLEQFPGVLELREIPNYVSIPPIDLLENQINGRRIDPFKLLSVGSLTVIKSHNVAIEALSLLDERFTLTIVGAGPRLDSLRRLAAAKGVSSRVHFRGFLTPSEVEAELADAAMLVHC
ncbi:MAG: glycosyltransferase [Spirosoma sp.]|nr:glycosyltransferase [Spirosoma sp.]